MESKVQNGIYRVVKDDEVSPISQIGMVVKFVSIRRAGLWICEAIATGKKFVLKSDQLKKF